MFLALQTLRGIGDFQLSHFHFNYSDEFLRRGFIGEILRLTGFPLSNKSVSLLYSLGVVLFLGLLVVITARTFQDRPRSIGVLFVLFLVACPGLTLHLAYSSYGYLDVFQLLMALLGLAVIARAGFLPAMAAAIVLSLLSMLTHEAGLIVTAPVLIAALSLKHPDIFGFSRAAALFVVFIGVAILIWRFGGADTVSFEDHSAGLAQTMGLAEPNDDSIAAVRVLHRSLADNVGLVLPRSASWYIWQQVKFLIFAAPYLLFFYLTIRAIGKRLSGLGDFILPAAIFAPVFLYPIGHDYFRWWSFAMANYFLLMLFLARIDTGHRDVLADMVDRHKLLLITGILIGATMGGIGGLVSFSVHTAPAAIFYRMIF